jgi:hypothetical protein
MEGDYLSVINSGSLAGVVFALLFERYLESKGIASPSEDIEGGLEELLGMQDGADIELLRDIDAQSGKGD